MRPASLADELLAAAMLDGDNSGGRFDLVLFFELGGGGKRRDVEVPTGVRASEQKVLFSFPSSPPRSLVNQHHRHPHHAVSRNRQAPDREDRPDLSGPQAETSGPG